AKPVSTDPQARQQSAIDAFLSNLTVTPELHSRVIDVSVTDKAGAQAAALANAVVSNYQRIALARQTADVNNVAQWLDARTGELRQRWLDAVHKADNFDVNHGLTNTTEGTTANPLIDRQITETAVNLSQAQARLAAAQARADALHDAAQHGNTSALVSLSEQPILVATANTLLQIQSMRDDTAAQYGRNYPKLRSLNRQLAAARASLNTQTRSALASIHEDLISARAETKQLSDNLDALRAQAGAQSSPQAEYQSLSEEAQSARGVYETFLNHAKEVVDRAALLEPPVSFVSHAPVPTRPTFPNHVKLLAGIIVLALVAGAAAVLARDYFSVGFEELDALRATVQLPVLAAIPFIASRRDHLIARHVLDEPFSRASEAVRGLAAQLSLLVEGDVSRSVLVTSASPEEGKSTLAVWLAITARQGEQKVLLIDGDHRRGGLMSKDRVQFGFTDLLDGRASLADVIQTDPETGIDFISAGKAMSRPFNASDIARLRGLMAGFKNSYNLVILDSPPLLAMTDALVHGSVVDQTVFVCRWQQTSRQAVTACLDRLRSYGARIPGIVVSMVDQNSTMAFGGDYSRREMKLISRAYST
ncbi:polysaccharide biosynthesis tyrosine autokinase, partial [Acidisoma sp. L85]|uniref:polysaccharide biosynthesis tyrosine autokinase n=1 Tax=Acidisoma sp. L85 TaxID=1641850 RepID=UPI001C2028BB